jgi:hypothetical protein
MLTLLHYLPWLLLAGFVALVLVLFTGDSRKTDYRRIPRERHYQWNDNSAHRDRH